MGDMFTVRNTALSLRGKHLHQRICMVTICVCARTYLHTYTYMTCGDADASTASER